jgi:hypothetical protein
MSTNDSIEKKWMEISTENIFDTVADCVDHVNNTRSTGQDLKFTEIIIITKE